MSEYNAKKFSKINLDLFLAGVAVMDVPLEKSVLPYCSRDIYSRGRYFLLHLYNNEAWTFLYNLTGSETLPLKAST
jgi:hypothetical protein